MAQSSTWKDFGVYPASNQTYNQNKRNTGYNNSLNEGLNFSTTLGANFSTVVGGNFSTTGGVTMSTVGGFNVPITLGGKVELISPWSIKWTKGGFSEVGKKGYFKGFSDYDYDFKDCETQVKKNQGKNIYTVNSPDLKEWKGAPGGEGTEVVDKKDDFVKSANQWLGTKSEVIQSEIRKVLDGNMAYETMTTTVTRDCVMSGGGGASVLDMTPTDMACTTQGTLKLNGSLDVVVTSKGKIQHNAPFINIG